MIREHVIAVDHDGGARDPMALCGPELTPCQYDCQIRQIFSGMQKFFGNRKDKTILVFVHGGLNPPADSLANADKEMDSVMAAGFYPIYLDWDSGIWSTYGEHILTITQGEDDKFPRELLFPAYLLADLGRAVARMPIVWINQFGSDFLGVGNDVSKLLPGNGGPASDIHTDKFAQSQRWAHGIRGTELAGLYQKLRCIQAKDELKPIRSELRVYVGPDYDVKASHMAGLGAMYVLTFPTKLISQPVIDWWGTPAWQVMSRRTLIAFDGNLGAGPTNSGADPLAIAQSEKRRQNQGDHSTVGAIETFREQLLEFTGVYDPETTDATGPPPKYEITLVGHSMGTMVLNEWLRRDMLEKKQPYYANIVYMAAACSIRDFSRGVIPYLLHHSKTQFFNLMLHPLADLRERSRGYDFIPRGSLLVWLDTFLTDPQTPLDRTLGRWDNVIEATGVIPPPARRQITLKAFALAPSNLPPPSGQLNYGPQEHGQFRDNPYWSSDFWTDQQPIVKNPPCPSTQPCP